MVEERTNFRYDLQVVEVMYAGGIETYEFTMGHYSYQILESAFEKTADSVEPLSVSYSFSPLTVVHKKSYQTFFEFARSLLSTLGGAFAILKILDNSIYLGRRISVKKREGNYSSLPAGIEVAQPQTIGRPHPLANARPAALMARVHRPLVVSQ